jgi:uncharacterized protein YdiU (UPF0061 family)
MLQQPLAAVIPLADMETALTKFDDVFYSNYLQLMLNKMGFEQLPEPQTNELLGLTLQFLVDSQVGYHAFFAQLAQQFNPSWRDDVDQIFNSALFLESAAEPDSLVKLREFYHHLLQTLSIDQMEDIAKRLQDKNPKTVLLRPVIETVWEAIAQEDNWQPFYELLKRIQAKQ